MQSAAGYLTYSHGSLLTWGEEAARFVKIVFHTALLNNLLFT
jgi:hypothetical protein